ncbi:MAG: hypothetical protein COA78_06940 [Blastopirellula sp.]|nr:MAG: hypothetical protein COA78_06940 [Blastopirellula sp.]
MANSVDLGSIKWWLGVDDSDLDRSERRVDQYGKTTDRVGRKAKKTTNEMAQGYKGVRTAVRAVTGALVAMGATRALTGVIKATANFGESISELAAITGAAGDDLAYFAEQSKDIGRTTTLSASQAATAFKLIASAKPDLLESASALNMVTREAVALAEAAKVDLPTAAETLGTSLNQFAKGAEDASRFINVLAAGSKLGASSISDTAMAMKNAGAAANALGVDFETANAAIQALAAGGLKAAEAGTGLRNILVILEQQSDQKLRPSINGLVGALRHLESQNLSNIEKIDLFGRMNLIAGETMLAQIDTLENLDEKLRGTSIAYEQAAINVDNLTGDWKANKSAAEGLQIALGEKLVPALRGASQEMTVLLNATTDFVESEQFGKTLGDIATAAELLGTVLGARLAVGLAKTAVKMLMAARGAGAFKIALTALGGPIGATVTILAGLAWAYRDVAKAQREAKEGAADWIADTGGLDNIQLSIRGVTDEIEGLRDVISGDRSFFKAFAGSDSNDARDRIKELELFLIELRRQEEQLLEVQRKTKAETDSRNVSVGVLKIGIHRLVKEETALDVVGRKLVDGLRQVEFRMEGVTDATRDMLEETDEAGDKDRALVDSLKTKLRLLGYSAREQFVYTEQMKLGAGATMEQRLEVEKLAGALYDGAVAQRDAAKADEERKKTSEQVAEAIQRDWERTRDTIAGALRKAGEEGFGSVVDASKDALKAIAYDWAAARLMDFTGISAFIGGGGLGSGGGLPGQSGGGSNIMSLITGASGTSGALGGPTIMSMLGGTSLAFGASQAGALGSAALGVGNSMIAPATAQAALAGSSGGIMAGMGAFITSPVGIAAAVLIAGKLIHDKTSDPDGFTRTMGGFLSGDTPGAAGATFGVPRFSSGLQVQGVATHSGGRAAAQSAINVFSSLDKNLSIAIRAAGGVIDLTRATLDGFGVDGLRGSQGTFFGTTGRTTEADFNAQQLSYARQLVGHIEGLTPEVMARLAGAGDVNQLMSILQELGAEITTAAETMAESVEAAAGSLSAFGVDMRNQLIARMDAVTPSAASFIGGNRFNAENLSEESIARAARTRANLSDPVYTKSLWDRMDPNTRPEDFRDMMTKVDGSHAGGLNSVPFDGYIAQLHKRERVITGSQADAMDGERGMGAGGMLGSGKISRDMRDALEDMARILTKWDLFGQPGTRTNQTP